MGLTANAQFALPMVNNGLRARPFLKWAGGKARLLPTLRTYIPPKFGKYYEPFLGGGAFFFDLIPDSAVLGDSNGELISCYKTVRDFPTELLDLLDRFTISEAEYYRIRALEPTILPPIERAARFIYLNKTCFNGLYRVNKCGQFNTPFGKYVKSVLADPSNLMIASSMLACVQLLCGDFMDILEGAKSGDFVYLDPPYHPISKFSDFKRYTKEQFHERDQERLAETFAKLSARGCYVLLSNSYQDKITELYPSFHHEKVLVPRFVNCKREGRGNVEELLISNYAPWD